MYSTGFKPALLSYNPELLKAASDPWYTLTCFKLWEQLQVGSEEPT